MTTQLTWPRGPGGLPYRRAARVLLLDEDGRIYLLLGRDFADPDRKWWFSVGGGIEDGETAREAACRELAEETGIQARPDELIGPVLERHSLFQFAALDARQDELYYVYRYSPLSPHGEVRLSVSEQEVLLERRWWEAAEIERLVEKGATVYPEQLAVLVRKLRAGWGGKCQFTTDFEDDTIRLCARS